MCRDAVGRAVGGPERPLVVWGWVLADQINLIDLCPPDDVEVGYRQAMARFDVPWHNEQAIKCEEAASWFAAAFHWGQLAEHDPKGGLTWQNLEAACSRLGKWHLALLACQRILERDPTQAAVYFHRARLRAPLLQFHEATADHLAGLALLGRTKR
jgi:hypothetical protein